MIHQELRLIGIIQGVGFRPFIYRLATGLSLRGWVQNSAQGVTIALEGEAETIALFQQRLFTEKPPLSSFQIVGIEDKPLASYPGFQIRVSAENTGDQSQKQALVLPDLATCSACLKEIFDPDDRRYQYPFTNCTYCGPRHSILLNLPYDRHYTTMKAFEMCKVCRAEYENPADRRFHAQPNACPLCGPQLTFYRQSYSHFNDPLNPPRSDRYPSDCTPSNPLEQTIAAILAGEIVAIKGIGGFHLVCDATNDTAVQTLRSRKHRPHKPFALMVRDVTTARYYCHCSPAEADLLTSPPAPIVLLRQRSPQNPTLKLAPSLAPHNPYLGMMLPYSPLHHLLLRALPCPIVATSGNRSDEPICIDNDEARQRLGDIADCFLWHDRPIARPLDDSIVRIIAGKPMILRRSRGYAPLPLPRNLPKNQPHPTLLAVGGHLKNTIAFTHQHHVFISPHLGDLDSVEAQQRFENTIEQSLNLYDFTPGIVAHDAHPDYASTHYAQRYAHAIGVPTIAVQHHHAHLFACWGEHEQQWIQDSATSLERSLDSSILGIVWDGTGYGNDGTIWGGEAFTGDPRQGIQRLAHLRPFPLLGGDRAAREPRRSALGLLYTAFGDALWDWNLPPVQTCTENDRRIFRTMLHNGVNVPLTSSMGRLFDGIAALLGLWPNISFEGQAAQALEFLIPMSAGSSQSWEESLKFSNLQGYSLPLDRRQTPWQWDWQPLVVSVLEDLAQGLPPASIALKFHHALSQSIVSLAQIVNTPAVFLSGGCFQNAYLLENTIAPLRQAGFTPYWPQQVPPNDGGIAFGQAIVAGQGFT